MQTPHKATGRWRSLRLPKQQNDHLSMEAIWPYNQWKWSISHGKISFVLSVEKGGAFGVFHQHEFKMKINSKNPFSDVAKVPQAKKINLETITYQ